MFKIIVYCSEQNHFEKQKKHLCEFGFSDQVIVYGDSKLFTREYFINKMENQWLLFLDHDCFILPTTKNFLLKSIAENEKKPVAYSGSYINPPGASALQRAHNTIANLWLEHSHLRPQNPGFILGGIFLIFTGRRIIEPEQKFWGAEDKLLAASLAEAGYSIKLENQLIVTHDTSRSFFHFVKRAFLHGKNDAIYFNKLEKTNVSYWLRKIDFADLSSMFLILLHFCIQITAKSLQRVRQLSKR